MMIFLNVEKHVEDDQKSILEFQKKRVLASGGEWIEPAKRLEMEQEDADRKAEEARQQDLMERCRKKGLDYKTEEEKYQARQRVNRKRK